MGICCDVPGCTRGVYHDHRGMVTAHAPLYRSSIESTPPPLPHPDAWNGGRAVARVARDDRRLAELRPEGPCVEYQSLPVPLVRRTAEEREQHYLTRIVAMNAEAAARAKEVVDLRLQRDIRESLLSRALPVLADAFPTHPEVAALCAEIKALVEPGR